jgi:hypothetical protein
MANIFTIMLVPVMAFFTACHIEEKWEGMGDFIPAALLALGFLFMWVAAWVSLIRGRDNWMEDLGM